MMKRLVMVRHGKSSWKYDLPDRERPLKKRAFKDAELVLNSLKGVFEKPATLWSSDATRALETAKLFKKKLSVDDENFHIKKELYTFNSEDLKAIILSCPDEIHQLFIFGHNPAITEIVNFFGNKHFENVPTTGLIMIDFETDSWKNLNDGDTILYLFPKNLR